MARRRTAAEQLAQEETIAAKADKYTGGWADVEPPGTPRYATSIIVERTTSQGGHP